MVAHESIKVITSEGDLEDPLLAEVYAYWKALPPGRPMLSRDDFFEIPRAARYSVLISGVRTEDIESFKVLFVGSGVVEFIQYDPTGQTIGEISRHTRFQALVRACASREWPVTDGPDHPTAEYISHRTFAQTCLPLFEADGKLQGILYTMSFS